MPIEPVGAGVAPVHDFPYAVSNYGQCKGSGSAVLAGPGTPPAAWGMESGLSFVELGVLPSPVPQVVRDGWTVTITGVRFTHGFRCWKCRKVVYIATEGGIIQLGFDTRGRSFEKLRPGRRAVYSGLCPNGCGNQLAIGTGWSGNDSEPRPVADGWTVQCREWESLRRDLGVPTPHMTRSDLARLRPAARQR